VEIASTNTLAAANLVGVAQFNALGFQMIPPIPCQWNAAFEVSIRRLPVFAYSGLLSVVLAATMLRHQFRGGK
jgi:hypothetical protein